MAEILKDVFLLFICLDIFFILFFFVEKIRPINNKQGVLTKYLKSDIIYPFINDILISKLFNILIVVSLLSVFVENHLPKQIFDKQIQAMPFSMQVFIASVLLDFIVYIRHYFTHVFMWPVHSIHHCVEEINWLTGYRLHPLEVMVAALCQYLLLHILGFGGEAIAFAGGIQIVMNLFTHTNLNIEFPAPLRYLISCPNYHRWHHATDKEAINKNLVVVFPFIDLIFGTYYFPKNKLPKKYGIYLNNGDEKVPDGFIKQLIYPVMKLKKKKKQ